MRNISIILILILFSWLNTWAVEDRTSVDSCARFEIIGQYLYDVGNINSDTDTVSGSFWLKSIGNLPLIIVSSSTSCPCAQVFYDHDIISPGDSVEIKLTIGIGSHLGAFMQSVLLKTNTKPQDYVWFYIKGNVVESKPKDDLQDGDD